MNKKLAILFGVLLISTCVFAQVEDDEAVHPPHNESPEIHEQEVHHATNTQTEQGGADEEMDAEKLMQDESFKERIRNLYVACIVTSRHKMNSYQQEILAMIQGITDKQLQQALYKKILAEFVYTCALYGTQNPNTPDQIIKSLQENTFKITDWDLIYMSMDVKKFSDPNYNTDLTEDESNILKFVDQFDEAMKKQGGSQEGAQGDDEGIPNMFGQQGAPATSIGGISLNSISKSGQFIYFLIIIGVFGAIIIYGYMKIDENTPQIKTKKDKKKN